MLPYSDVCSWPMLLYSDVWSWPMLPYSDYVELAHATLQATVICVQEGAEGAVEQPQPADGALRPAGPADTATAVPAA